MIKISCPHCTATNHLSCFNCKKPLPPDLRAIDEAIEWVVNRLEAISINQYKPHEIADALQEIRLKYSNAQSGA